MWGLECGLQRKMTEMSAHQCPWMSVNNMGGAQRSSQGDAEVPRNAIACNDRLRTRVSRIKRKI